MTCSVHIDALDRLKQAAEAKIAANPALAKLLLAGGAGAAVGGGLGAHLMHGRDEAARARTRNTSFGAGMAAGLAGPQLVNRLYDRMHPSTGEVPQ